MTSLINDLAVGGLSSTVAGAAAADELGAGSYSEVIINASLLWQDGYDARYTP